MSNIWFTADHHFHHKNIIKLCDRPYEDLDEMHNAMIIRWNAKIKLDDVVYHLGDFDFKNSKCAHSVLDRINGRIHFIHGNHDNWVSKNAHTHKREFPKRVSFLPPLYEFRINKRRFVLCHYPLMEWRGSYHDTIHLFGHCHGNLKDPRPNSMDVGVDTNEFYPYSLDDILERFPKRIK